MVARNKKSKEICNNGTVDFVRNKASHLRLGELLARKNLKDYKATNTVMVTLQPESEMHRAGEINSALLIGHFYCQCLRSSDRHPQPPARIN
jgi:hypothetical protein